MLCIFLQIEFLVEMIKSDWTEIFIVNVSYDKINFILWNKESHETQTPRFFRVKFSIQIQKVMFTYIFWVKFFSITLLQVFQGSSHDFCPKILLCL